MFEDVFIAIYTNECKSYCDDKFFGNLRMSNTGSAKIMVVDNTMEDNYFKSLQKRFGDFADIRHIYVLRYDPATQFQRNVTESLLVLREEFLLGSYKYFIILESDVLPEDPEWLNKFMEVVDSGDIIGGLYYKGFQPDELWEGPPRLAPTHHVLSGCTLYKRYVIEQFPFRWSRENIGAFPDAWICYDCNRNNPPQTTRLVNYTGIKSKHLEKAPGDRGHGDIK